MAELINSTEIIELLNTSEPFVDEDSDCTCSIKYGDIFFENPPGIDDVELLKLPKDLNNHEFLLRLEELCTELQQVNYKEKEERNNILISILSHVSTLKCNTFNDFLWILEFTVVFLLLREKTYETINVENDFLNSLTKINVEQFTYNPVSNHTIAEALFNILQNDFNLIAIAKRIFRINRVCYYVSVTLVISALKRSQNEEIQTHHIQSITSVISSITNVHPDNIKTNLSELYRVLNLLSLYQSLVLLRKQNMKEDHGIYERVLSFTKGDIETIKLWLIKARKLIEFWLLRDPSKTKLLYINNFIDIDMISSLDRIQY